jgi:ferric-dicitrate binding protein FerR (iron transport regulator)
VSGRDTTDRLDRARELLMRALDGEMTEIEREELEALLAADPELRAERDRLARLTEVTAEMKPRNPPEEIWDGYWNSVYSRVERGIGWILVSLGAIVVGGWAVWEGTKDLLVDPTLPGLVKAGILALGFGLVILLVSVARHRLFVFRTDPYKDIER